MDIAKHLRIVHVNPDDDLVSKRIKAIKALSKGFTSSSTLEEIFERVSAACAIFMQQVELPDSFAANVTAAIKEESVSFVQDGHELEVGICGMLGIMDAISTAAVSQDAGWYITDVTAAAAWSALSFLPPSEGPGLEELRHEAIAIARKRILAVGLESRTRRTIPSLGQFGDEHVTSEDFKKATKPTIEAFQRNAALDREEIDLLWWFLAGASEIYEKPFSALPVFPRAIALGLEMAGFMRSMPTPAHRNLLLHHVNGDESATLTELLEGLGEHCTKLSGVLEYKSVIENAPRVFPLLSSIYKGQDASLGGDMARSISDWALRALLERTVVHLIDSAHRNA